MTELKHFKLPDVGEGLTEAEILRWQVAVGDTVVVNQPLVEVETAKAAVELPCPYAGVIREIHFQTGDTVAVGAPIITIEVAASAIGERQAVLVGYGVANERGRRRKRAQPDLSPAPSANAVFGVAHAAGDKPAGERVVSSVAVSSQSSEPSVAPVSDQAVLAKPPVRKLAKTLGVDLTVVAPTGPNGSISRVDVEAASHATANGESAVVEGVQGLRQLSSGRETRVPIKGIRKVTAAAMVSSAFTAPHVTEFITVEVSELMAMRERIAQRPEFRDVKVTPLVLVARAVLWAATRTPIINSTWDEPAGEIVVRHYVNLGIAAATDRGLIVPNIKDAESLPLLDLARAIGTLSTTARAGRTTPAEMANGTFTITNVGVFGIDTGTPIINPGEAAILALGAIRRQPWVVETDGVERIEPRWVTQLAVSFDHRSVDGKQGSEFLADVAAVLHDPTLAFLN